MKFPEIDWDCFISKYELHILTMRTVTVSYVFSIYIERFVFGVEIN